MGTGEDPCRLVTLVDVHLVQVDLDPHCSPKDIHQIIWVRVEYRRARRPDNDGDALVVM